MEGDDVVLLFYLIIPSFYVLNFYFLFISASIIAGIVAVVRHSVSKQVDVDGKKSFFFIIFVHWILFFLNVYK
jgi:hypothetical protein